jgi:hypothetical protein
MGRKSSTHKELKRALASFVAKPEGKRPLRRTRSRWERDIKSVEVSMCTGYK